jgi:kynureninase
MKTAEKFKLPVFTFVDTPGAYPGIDAEEALRGSQVSLTRTEGAYAIVQALIARGVIGDFRAGDGGLHADILRFGFTPLYVGYADVWQAAEHLCQVMQSGEWQDARFAQKNAVT